MANNDSNGFTAVNLYLQPLRSPNTPNLQQNSLLKSPLLQHTLFHLLICLCSQE